MTIGGDASAPWLSVIMPAYGGEEWIDTALGSLAAERSEGIEILLIDGSPTPATRKRAEKFSGRLRLRIFERPDLSLWHGKTNFGVEVAESGNICLLCVDDVWLPGRAAAVRGWIEAAPEAALHLAPSAIIDRQGQRLGVWRCPLPSGSALSGGMVAERLLVQNFVASPAPVFRKDAWLECGGLDEQLWYTADWDIWLKLASLNTVYYHSEVTCGFRIHGGSLTMSGRRDMADLTLQMRSVLERHLTRLSPVSASVERAARASIVVNTALASASSGDFTGLAGAASAVVRLGPGGIRRFFRDSRLFERVAPRVRARLRGAL
jgi:glycosyltransferase involved in cell wall biosynthesis